MTIISGDFYNACKWCGSMSHEYYQCNQAPKEPMNTYDCLEDHSTPIGDTFRAYRYRVLSEGGSTFRIRLEDGRIEHREVGDAERGVPWEHVRTLPIGPWLTGSSRECFDTVIAAYYDEITEVTSPNFAPEPAIG